MEYQSGIVAIEGYKEFEHVIFVKKSPQIHNWLKIYPAI